MKYMIGYGIQSTERFIDEIINNKDRISEVYFSWGDFPNGRSNALGNSELTYISAMEKQMSDLRRMSENGLKFNLLLNGNCYGRQSLSRAFFEKIGETTDYILTSYGLSSITTTSPIIAKFIKDNFKDLEVRASVNMDIGTIEGMDYVSQYFDGYYMKREFNKNIHKIKEMKSYCDDNGKRLYMLANSGCLNNCSARTFHDNLVSHEKEISETDNAYLFPGICHDYLKNSKNREKYLSITSFVRPEDIHLYKEYFHGFKLATRTSPTPIQIMHAYFNERHFGNIMDLTEPNHSGIMYPYVIENKKLPADFGEQVLNCDKKCGQCNFCANAFKNALTNIETN